MRVLWKNKWCNADILIPHERAVTLVFWHQHWLVGDAPFPLKYSPKVTHPRAKLIIWCKQYFICIRHMVLRSRYSCLTNNYHVSPSTEPVAMLTTAKWTFRTRQSHRLSVIAELLVHLLDASFVSNISTAETLPVMILHWHCHNAEVDSISIKWHILMEHKHCMLPSV